MAVKTFTTGEVLTASDTNTYLANAGLVYITSTSVGTGGSLTISNCFSSTYNNYRFVFDNLKVASGTIFITMQLRSGTTTNTAGYYDSRIEVNLAGTVTGAGTTNGANWTPPLVGDATYSVGAAFDIWNPYNAVHTSFSGVGIDGRTTGAPYRSGGGWHNSTTSFTSIVFTASTNFATGNLTIYGYRQA